MPISERLTMSLVSLIRTDHSPNLKSAIENSVDLIHFSLSSSIRNVAVKPNMCYYLDYSTGETTDPNFVAAIIDFLRERISSNLKISVVESDASAMKCKHAFKMLGYEKMANEKKVKLVNLSEDKNEEINVKIANLSYKFLLPRTISNADLFINVPKIKYMAHTKISCALKNIYGCNPYPRKFKYHTHLDEAIVCLNKLMTPNLCLVDGIIARGKHTMKLGLVMASSDPVAIDSATAKIVGLNPKQIEHIVLAEKERLGEMNYKTVGENLEYFVHRFPTKNARDKIRSTIIDFGLLALRKLGRDVDSFIA